MKKRLVDIYLSDYQIKLFPFIKTIKRYNLKTFKDDLMAGMSVALMAIPQSIAYSLLANLPIQAGIFAAIFGAIFSGAFGSSKHLIAGPSTGVSILIQMIISNIMHIHFPTLEGAQREIVILNLLTQLVFMIGIMQLVFGFLNLGKLLQFVSRSVILGYFAGVGIAIIVNQLFYIFGINITTFEPSIVDKLKLFIEHLNEINWLAFFIGILSLCLLVLLKFRFHRFPNALTMVIFTSVFVYFLNFFISNHKYKVPTVLDLGMSGIPAVKLVVPFINFNFFDILLFPALAVAMLSILEVSSISKGIAARSGQKIRSNQEIFGIGIANFVLSFFYSAMPSSASVSRTTLNFNAGAKTRMASIFSGIITLLLIFLFYPLVKLIPLSALAAILIVMVASVVEIRHVKLCFRATLGDAIAFSLTMASCLVFRLDVAFFIGIVISIIFFLQRAAEPNLVEYVFDNNKLVVVSPKKFPHRNIRIIGIAGELFFAAVDLFQNTMQRIIKDRDVKVIILRLKNIYHVDASICLAILRLNDYLISTNRYLLISGITEEVWQIFQKCGIVKQLGEDKVFLTSEEKPLLSTKHAVHRAKKLIS
jgi:sulfate permease, SulP family